MPPKVDNKKRKVPSEPGPKLDSSYAADNAFYRFLCTTKAENFAIGGPPEKTPIFTCTRTDKIVDVWKGLIQKNFLAVPVVLEDQRYFGFITVMDIVKYVVQHFKEADTLSHSENYWALVEEEKTFEEKTVNDLLTWPYSRKNPFHPVKKGYSAFTVMEALARETGLHRVPIVDENRQIVNLVTQSQVVAFLAQYIDILGEKLKKPLSECKQFYKEVLSSREQSTAMEAFSKMVDNGVSGLAVVDETGRLKAHLSVRDLKVISADAKMFNRLTQKIVNFITKLRSEYQEKNGRPRTVVCVTGEDTLGSTIKLLAAHRVHRVCIVDAKKTKKVVGIVTLQDLIKELIE